MTIPQLPKLPSTFTHFVEKPNRDDMDEFVVQCVIAMSTHQHYSHLTFDEVYQELLELLPEKAKP